MFCWLFSADLDYEDEVCDDVIKQTDTGFLLEIQAPDMLYKYIIGKKGDTKHRLEVETKTQIQVPKPGQTGSIGL